MLYYLLLCLIIYLNMLLVTKHNKEKKMVNPIIVHSDLSYVGGIR